MKKVLFLISQKNFRDEELKIPREILERAGYSTKVASETAKIAEGTMGMKEQPDMNFSEAFRRADEFDAIVVVGGQGSPNIANDRYALMLLRKAREAHKVIAAICMAPYVLAKADILTGKKATIWARDATDPQIKIIKAAGAKYVQETVVVDGKTITAAGPQYAADFGRAVLRVLQGI